MAIEVFAPAKVNLALHVTGRRGDGYHLLDSLVVFAEVGDRLRVEPAAELSLTITGPGASAVPGGADNLVLRAAHHLQRRAKAGAGARLILEKLLPAASGLGGGSADAAAALRALARLWRLPLPVPAETSALGADVPVCLYGAPARMRGIGERLSPVPPLPPVWLLLVNPRIETPTGAVFAALEPGARPPMPERIPRWRDAAHLAEWLADMRNDLQAPACRLCPAIAEVLIALEAQPGALIARMSGSGASCYALFAAQDGAAAAAAALRSGRPDWWVAQAPVIAAGPVAAADQELRSTM